jgi:long-subunit acyl-CoA synthetase (AMP-forming)
MRDSIATARTSVETALPPVLTRLTAIENLAGDDEECAEVLAGLRRTLTRQQNAFFRYAATAGTADGDQAELDPSGSLKLIGRVKNVLVPLSGHNVAPEPIEEKLLRLPGVEQAVVFGHARPYLVAVLTGDLDRAALAAPLAAINDELPFYKRVREVHLSTERLTPENGCLTANQKLKRKAIERHFKSALDALYEKGGPA